MPASSQFTILSDATRLGTYSCSLSEEARGDRARRLRVWHANLGPFETPQLADLHEDIWDIIDSNAQDGDRVKGAIAIDAFPGLGKTTAVMAFARKYHLREIAEKGRLTPDGHERLPVCRVGLTGNTSMKDLNRSLLELYGHSGRHRGTTAQMAHRALDCVQSCHCRLLIIDDRERDGHMHVTATAWAKIDVESVENAIKEQASIRDRVLANSDILQQLKQAEETVQKEHDDTERLMYAAEGEQEKLDQKYRLLTEDQERNSVLLQGLEGDASAVLTAEQETRLQAEYEKTSQPWRRDDFQATIPRIRQAFADQASRARKEAESQEKLLCAAFQRFQDRWERPNLGIGVDSHDGYREILDHLRAEGLHERRGRFSRQVSDWTGVDLLALHGAYEESIDEIETRLVPVNEILARLPFGQGRDRLHINLRRTESKD